MSVSRKAILRSLMSLALLMPCVAVAASGFDASALAKASAGRARGLNPASSASVFGAATTTAGGPGTGGTATKSIQKATLVSNCEAHTGDASSWPVAGSPAGLAVSCGMVEGTPQVRICNPDAATDCSVIVPGGSGAPTQTVVAGEHIAVAMEGKGTDINGRPGDVLVVSVAHGYSGSAEGLTAQGNAAHLSATGLNATASTLSRSAGVYNGATGATVVPPSSASQAAVARSTTTGIGTIAANCYKGQNTNATAGSAVSTCDGTQSVTVIAPGAGGSASCDPSDPNCISANDEGLDRQPAQANNKAFASAMQAAGIAQGIQKQILGGSTCPPRDPHAGQPKCLDWTTVTYPMTKTCETNPAPGSTGGGTASGLALAAEAGGGSTTVTTSCEAPGKTSDSSCDVRVNFTSESCGATATFTAHDCTQSWAPRVEQNPGCVPGTQYTGTAKTMFSETLFGGVIGNIKMTMTATCPARGARNVPISFSYKDGAGSGSSGNVSVPAVMGSAAYAPPDVFVTTEPYLSGTQCLAVQRQGAGLPTDSGSWSGTLGIGWGSAKATDAIQLLYAGSTCTGATCTGTWLLVLDTGWKGNGLFGMKFGGAGTADFATRTACRPATLPWPMGANETVVVPYTFTYGNPEFSVFNGVQEHDDCGAFQ